MADGMGNPFTLTEVRHAIIVPPPPRLPTRRLLPLAVLDANGAAVPDTDCATNRLSSAGFAPSPDQLLNPAILPGTWLYGGLASHHFGHQITRSLGRLQGLAHAGKIDGIVFAPLDARARSDASQKLMTRLFSGVDEVVSGAADEILRHVGPVAAPQRVAERRSPHGADIREAVGADPPRCRWHRCHTPCRSPAQ